MGIVDTAKDIFGNIKSTFTDGLALPKAEDLKKLKEPDLDDPLTKAFQDNEDYYKEMGANNPEAVARALTSEYLGVGESTDILPNQAIVSFNDDNTVSVTDKYPNSAFGGASIFNMPGVGLVIHDPHRASFFKIRMKSEKQKYRHGGEEPFYRDEVSAEKIQEMTGEDLTGLLLTKQQEMQEVLRNTPGAQAGRAIFYGELAFLSLLAPQVAAGVYYAPQATKNAMSFITRKYDEIVNKVKTGEIDPKVADNELMILNDQAKNVMADMGVTSKHKNQLERMINGETNTVANMSKTDDFTNVPNVKNVTYTPKPTDYNKVDVTSQDFKDFMASPLASQSKQTPNQITAYVAFNKVKNDFFKQNKKYDNVEEAWNYVTDFTAQQKAAGKKGATKDYTRVMQKYIDEIDAKDVIDETTGKQISLDDWFIPKNVDGSIASNPDKARARLLQGRAKWNEIRNDKRVKKMEGYDTIGKQQVDRLLLYMRRGGEDNFKRLYDDKGNIIGFKVLNKTEPGYGNSYYKAAYVNKNPQMFNRSNSRKFSIKEHPTWQLQQDMMQVAKDVRFATLNDNISQQIFDVVGDFSIYGKQGKPFGLNQLGDYLYTLDKYPDPTIANLAGFKSLGKKNIIEIHHTKGVSSSATDPNFLQTVTKQENAIASSIASGFYKNVERVGVEEAIKLAKSRAANFPNVQMVFEVDGQIFKIGKNTKPNKIVDRVKNEIDELWSKHLEGKPEEIKKMAEVFNLRTPKGNSMGGLPIRREGFVVPGRVGDSTEEREEEVKKRTTPIFADYLSAKVDQSTERENFDKLPESQKKQMAFFLKDPVMGQERIERERVADASVRYKIDEKDETISGIRARIAEEMIDAKPTKFPLSSFSKLLTENPLTKSMQRQFNLPFLILGDVANNILNQMGGDEKTFQERYPVLSENLAKPFTPVEGTDQEAKYIDGIDEINRALETGVRNLGFNTMDLVLGGIDLTGFGDGTLSEKLREVYEQTPKNDPETFMGDLLALLTEFGVPGGLVTKLVTRIQKAMRIKGYNTMTRYIDDDITGGARFAMQASNIAKRMGTGAVIFGAADAIGGGPYNSLTRMLPDDATLLPGKPIDTTNLSGRELALANLKNRIRFGADGAMIGGLFPLLGPPAWALTKGTAALPFKTIPGINRSLFGGALQLAGVPLKIAADSLAGKIPYTNKTIPLVGEGISYLGKQGASLAQKSAAFMGKQVFTRAALGIYDAAYAKASLYTGVKPNTTMFSKNLPDFQDWRKFSVNSKDPLHQYLAKIDNKLAMFRDIGKLGKDAFATKTQSDLYIRAKSRAVEKYLIDIERIAYKLAKGFEERHQKYGEFETIQKKYLDDVLSFLEGKVKIDDLPKQLQVPANDLRNYTNGLKREFGELLPTTDPIKYLIDSDINAMMRRSFAAFTNNSYAPTPQSVNGAKTFIKDLILGNNGLRMEAEMAFPNKSIADAIDEFASLKVADIMHTAKYEMSEPFKALETITRKLGLDDLVLRTGEELPLAIRKLLGEEKNLRSSLLQTTGNIIASTSQKKSLDKIAEMGLANGWLFRTQDEALGKGILNAASLSDVKGSGFLLNDAIGLYGTPELIKQLGGYSLFDGFLKSTIYQNILAMKAMVQGGKTLYSPATQMRNVGSAALFALNVGHIGGSASVPQAFKIVMDDIFGPGRNVDKKKLNKFIERKIELGVIDENVVSQELTAILNDLKGATKETGEPVISNLNQLIQRVGNAQLSQYVQRLYAGGDNLWKLYGHEFYISELKQFTKSIDDVKRYFNDIVGREFVELSPKTGVNKTVMEGIEEIAAHLVRDTYPTYSRVPPAVQAIRKLPIGNFISFPAEMLRTTATTLSTSLKHIASGNPGLQSMGYRSLFGQFTTLYGVNEGVKALGHSMTDVSPEALRAYQSGLGPSFMENHLMVPLTNKDPKTGEFKAFDLSSYNPYAYVIDPIESFIRELGTTRMSVDEVEGEVYNRIFDVASPFMAFIEPFTAETILLEPMFDIWARQGKARSGKTIYSPTDDFGDKVSKSFQHILETVAPGFVRSTGQVLNALSLDTKQGRLNDLTDVLIRLIGGSIINVDPVGALDYKAIDIREIRSNAYKTEHFFSKENALERGPDVLAAEFQDIQNEALAAQFEVYKMFAQALDSGLLTRDQIERVLGKDGRNVPNLDNLMDGVFTPVSYSESGLEQRADELYSEYKKNGISINRSDLMPFGKLDNIIFRMEDIRFKDLEDPNRTPLPTPSGSGTPSLFNIMGEQETEPVTPELPNTPTPMVPNVNPTVNPITGLTTTETALLSPGEQAIRQRQKGIA